MKVNPDYKSVTSVNKLIHEPSRIAVMTLLSVVEEADFLYIMNSTGLTQGNLSSHLSKLEEAGYIDITKTFKGKRPHTIIRQTEKGSQELFSYIEVMKGFLNCIK